MNHPADEDLAELVGNYEQVADAVQKIKALYELLNPAPTSEE